MAGFKLILKVMAAILGALLFMLIPFATWYMREPSYKDIQILDKTVPTLSRREHKALFWVLSNLKIHNYKTGRAFDYKSDYFGFFPRNPAKYDIRELPYLGEPPDIIYLCDSYGVYEDDYFNSESTGKRSALIYGGLDKREMDYIEKCNSSGTFVIGEFNTFASPTEEIIRKRLEKLFTVEWSGWISRYFDDLSEKNAEIPAWLISNYENNDRKWSFKGPGQVFVHEDGKVVVLRLGQELTEERTRINITDKVLLNGGTSPSSFFPFWCEIVKTSKGVSTLGYFEVGVTKKGLSMLDLNGIPRAFPAVTAKSVDSKTLYFAGDFSDYDLLPFYTATYLLPRIYRFMTIENPDDNRYFFWNIYYPLLSEALKE